MQARRTVVTPCSPVFSATRADARPGRGCDRTHGPRPGPASGAPPTRRTPATRPRVRSRGPMRPPRIRAWCCRTQDHYSSHDPPDRAASRACALHTSARPAREPSAIGGAATSSFQGPQGRTGHEQLPDSGRCSGPSSSRRASRQMDVRVPPVLGQRTARSTPCASVHPPHSSPGRSATRAGASRSATNPEVPRPDRPRPMRARQRACPPSSSAVECVDPEPSHRQPRARH